MMQAFGPYAERETVDFRNAVASGLFGIYGPTGSGKSSIFNAMTFALFGEATRTEQDTASLRSGHADPAVLTEVEFVFEIGEKTYLVRRRPEQMRPKQKGIGETRAPHEAWLFDISGLALEHLSEANTGRVIAEKKVNVVEAAVTGLLGYGAPQFRQIVLLPQGEFAKFLAADTKDRLAILRQLFDVSIYKRLAERFRADAKSAEDRVKGERAICDGRLRAEGFENADKLAEGIVSAQALHEGEQHRETAARQAVADARLRLDTDRMLDARFLAAEEAASDLDALQANDNDIQLLKTRVANARRAQALGDVERHWRDETIAVAKTASKRDEKARQSSEAEAKASAAAKSLETEQSRAGEIDALRKHREDLERHVESLASAAGLEIARRDAEGVLVNLTEKHSRADNALVTLRSTKASMEQLLTIARATQDQRHFLDLERFTLASEHKAAEAFEKARVALGETVNDVARLTIGHKASVEQAARAKVRAEAAEANLAHAQAHHLAAKLTPGEACPVCGALDHPAPASGGINDVGLNDAFKQARLEWHRAQTTEQESSSRLASAQTMVTERSGRFSELPAPAQAAADIHQRLEGVIKKLAALSPGAEIAATEVRLVSLNAEIVLAEAAREKLLSERQAASQSQALSRDRLETALATIPDTLRQKDKLESALAETWCRLAARQTALTTAEQLATLLREAALGAAKDAEAAAIAHDEARIRRDRAYATFKDRLVESGLDEQQYDTFKPLIAMIEHDNSHIDDHARKLSLASHQDEAARQAITGAVRPDLEPVQTALNDAEAALELAINRRAQAEARWLQLRKLQQDIADILLRLEQQEAETAPLRELAGRFNADNSFNLDLETFAIGEMFSQVLEAANLRYAPMSSGRYLFQRASEESGGRSRRGLGIDIFDIFIGKSRSPKTLSGGETFIAALALALGLSDIVESMSGRVRLDTIFIDEGFGSLDTGNESGTLEQVLDVLRNLVSQNRAVGLISHVPQVQDSIPNGFYIRKDMRGSRVETRDSI